MSVHSPSQPSRTLLEGGAPVQASALPAEWRDFFALTKPRVMTLVIFTAICGLLAAVLNQWREADIDAGRKRTANRPLPGGRIRREDARDFGLFLSGVSLALMGLAIGWLAAALLLAAIIYYAVIYTMWLKPRTPQNIVIGGGAGAFPPLIGWVAVTGEVTAMPILLFAIIFMWTPPHFWALALFVKTDYAKVGIPMVDWRHELALWQHRRRSLASFHCAGLAGLSPGSGDGQRRADGRGNPPFQIQHRLSLRAVCRAGGGPRA